MQSYLFRIYLVLCLCAGLVQPTLALPTQGIHPKPAEAFYYLDYPENVRHPGLLASLRLRRGSPARVFFHYRNCTPSVQQFWLRTTGALQNARWGLGSDWIPGHAGSLAARSFFSRIPTGPRPIVLLGILRPRMVISGILEGVPTADLRVLCRMGSGPPIRSARVVVTRHISWRIKVALTHQRRWARLRIGDKLAGHIDGDYGATIQIQAVAPLHSRLRVTLSPRGGDIRFVYRHNGVVHLVPGCKAYGIYELYTVPVSSVDTLEIIPVGGYCYPIQIVYSFRERPAARKRINPRLLLTHPALKAHRAPGVPVNIHTLRLTHSHAHPPPHPHTPTSTHPHTLTPSHPSTHRRPLAPRRPPAPRPLEYLSPRPEPARSLIPKPVHPRIHAPDDLLPYLPIPPSSLSLHPSRRLRPPWQPHSRTAGRLVSHAPPHAFTARLPSPARTTLRSIHSHPSSSLLHLSRLRLPPSKLRLPPSLHPSPGSSSIKARSSLPLKSHHPAARPHSRPEM